MLQTKITKYRLSFSFKYESNSKSWNHVGFCDYGLIVLDGNYL